jgi:hypothetical protein
VSKSTVDIPGPEIVLGDVVRLIDGPYGWATVVKIEKDAIHLFRPYVHIGNFTYTGGVLHYIGTETLTIIRSSRSYTVDAYTHEQMTKEGALR